MTVLDVVGLVDLEELLDRPLDHFLVGFRGSFALFQNNPIFISLVRLVLECSILVSNYSHIVAFRPMHVAM